ncbi:hypothetical protein ShzoTeo12_03880 [Shinella zoogloeoides]|nr:hypothetical protein ShzoTeo12_03880 [Shinella zoogloeoides]
MSRRLAPALQAATQALRLHIAQVPRSDRHDVFPPGTRGIGRHLDEAIDLIGNDGAATCHRLAGQKHDSGSACRRSSGSRKGRRSDEELRAAGSRLADLACEIPRARTQIVHGKRQLAGCKFLGCQCRAVPIVVGGARHAAIDEEIDMGAARSDTRGNVGRRMAFVRGAVQCLRRRARLTGGQQCKRKRAGAENAATAKKNAHGSVHVLKHARMETFALVEPILVAIARLEITIGLAAGDLRL